MAYLTHTYHGPAHPRGKLGTNLDLSKVETISGAFHVEDFQDGFGVLLSNGERPEGRWVVVGEHKKEVRPA